MSHNFVTIVSGLPRSGTSLMMQMLAAEGLQVLTDGQRTADQHNPRGYFELEAVKHTRTDHSWSAGVRIPCSRFLKKDCSRLLPW